MIDVFKLMAQDRDGDEMYECWNESLIKAFRPTKIPLSLIDETKKSAMSDSVWGLRNFYPWFVSEWNSGSNDDFVKLMVKLLNYNHTTIVSRRYWFFRGDCNVFKFWIKVRLLLCPFFILDFR
jgi:hypothetical protein